MLAAAAGLVVNTLAVLTVAWKGGMMLGRLIEAVKTQTAEIMRLRDWRHAADNLAVVVSDHTERLERLERKAG